MKAIIRIFFLAVLMTVNTLALNAKVQCDTVRVLAIGNSFSQDAVEQYLHELGEAEGYELVIGNLFIGGCSLYWWLLFGTTCK